MNLNLDMVNDVTYEHKKNYYKILCIMDYTRDKSLSQQYISPYSIVQRQQVSVCKCA
jgi:hypothetical protein